MSDPLATFIVPTLLRYFRPGTPIAAQGDAVRRADREVLLLHWAVSPAIADVARYLREHPHEVRAALTPRAATASGTMRGRIHAAATVLTEARTGDPSMFVFDEPFRSNATGPNRVLVWTMSYATQLARRFRQMLPDDATYRVGAVATLRLIEGVSRMLPLLQTSDLTAPSANDVRAARASRLLLYRKAAAAYDLFRAVERRDLVAIETLLAATLVGPTERWRQFELALALGMAEAIATHLGVEARLRLVLPGAADVLIDVGPYGVRWQKAGPTFQRPALERWEEQEVAILSDYGVSAGYDRPDVVLYDIASDRTLAVGEAKYFESDDWTDRLRDAVGQVVRYARGYETSQGDAGAIIARSIIALWSMGAVQTPAATARTPFVATFADFFAGLGVWATRALTDIRSDPPSSGSASPSSSVASVAGG